MREIHGHTNIQREGQVFICRPEGGFNIEGVKEYEIFFEQEVERIKDKPWAIVEILEEFGTGGPEVMKRIGAQFLWCSNNNCRCLAVVSRSSMTRYIIDTFFPIADMDIRIFEEKDTAIDWVSTILSKCEITG